MDNTKKIEQYPNVSFIDNTSFDALQSRMIRNYEQKYKELTGKDITLAAADPYRLILYACAVDIYQGYQYEDRAGKMGLLKYSTGDFLDNLAALKGVTRNEAAAAETVVRFTLSETISRDAVIPAGIRVKGIDLYFETTEPGTIPAGKLTVDIRARCQVTGATGNGLRPGDINTLVEPLPYTLKVSNIEETVGGTDRETDEALAERIYLAPAQYSTAGPASAYEYWVRTYSSAITECRVTSEAPGEVDIYITVDGGLPSDDFMTRLKEYLDRSNTKPLTDKVVIHKPEEVTYEIEATYYIATDDRDAIETRKTAIEAACTDYIIWQKSIGRDITPARLIFEMMKAGAQSVEVKKPSYQEIGSNQLAITDTPAITYGGLRDG